MTQKNEEDTQNSTPAVAEQEHQGKSEQGETQTVSDEQVKDDGSGTHGRPSDDSDPGHS